MTSIDLHIKYKFETGEYPNSESYIEWLENHFSTNLILEYKFETGLNNKRTIYHNSNEECICEYTAEYKKWLEEKLCKT